MTSNGNNEEIKEKTNNPQQEQTFEEKINFLKQHSNNSRAKATIKFSKLFGDILGVEDSEKQEILNEAISDIITSAVTETAILQHQAMLEHRKQQEIISNQN